MVQSAPPLISRRVDRIIFWIIIAAILAYFCYTAGRALVFKISQSMLPLPQVLQHVRFFDIHAPDDSGGLIAKLSDRNHPALLALLKQSVPATPPSQSRPDFLIIINCTTATVELHQYNYFLSSAEIGHGKEWRRVPPAFNDWMKTLKKVPASYVPLAPARNDGTPIGISSPKLKPK